MPGVDVGNPPLSQIEFSGGVSVAQGLRVTVLPPDPPLGQANVDGSGAGTK